MEQNQLDNGTIDEDWVAVLPKSVGARFSKGGLKERVHIWALVLDSRSIPCSIVQHDSEWQLTVPTVFREVAQNELSLYEEKNRNWPPPIPPARPLIENTLSTLSILILLATFHNFTLLDISLPGHGAIDWTAQGSANSAKILSGQWWRLVTALTLHADSVHLLSNLAIGGVFVFYLCRDLGSGLAWNLLLGSGILGNLANALVQSPEHSSVGASTAVFGAVGILAALTLVRYRHHLQKRLLLPVAAALALLALLGTEGKRTDLGAHLFGFVFGVGLGLIAEFLTGKFGRPGRVLNALLALAGAAVVVLAWWAALTS